MSNKIIRDLLASAKIKPRSFEAELGMLCHKWIILEGLDPVIEALHNEVHALSFQQDEVRTLPPPLPAQS